MLNQQLSLLDEFQNSLPQMPYCADDVEKGIYREMREKAVKKLHIQPNPHQFVNWLVFDVDRPDAHDLWLDCKLHPNIVCINQDNQHAHYFLRLATPVCMTENAKPGPIRYLKNVIRGVNALYDGDEGYTRLIAKNPLNERWITYTPRIEPYQLSDLREFSELAANNDRFSRQREIDSVTGRNKGLFDLLRFWCYDRVDIARQQSSFEAFQRDAQVYAEAANAFEIPSIFNKEPLDAKEIAPIVRSVTRWVWAHYDAQYEKKNRGALKLGMTRHHSIEAPTLSDDERKARQRAGAEYTHKAQKATTEAEIRKAVAMLRLEGKRLSVAAVARRAGVHRNTVSRDYKHLLSEV